MDRYQWRILWQHFGRELSLVIVFFIGVGCMAFILWIILEVLK
jgi:hypothetical protein